MTDREIPTASSTRGGPAHEHPRRTPHDRGPGLHRHRRRLGHPRRRGARRPHRRQHGPPAPVHARGAAAGAGAGGGDGHAGPLRDRLPAHRHREELRVPHLDPGRHVRDARGLPVAALHRDRLLPRHREAAGRRSAPAGPAGPRHADGDQPDRLAPCGAGHRRHGARRAHRHDQRFPRARGPAAPAGAPHRPAHEPRVHPPGRPRAGLPGRLRRGRPGRREADPRPAARLRQAAHRPADLAPAVGERGLPAARRLPGARRHRPDPAVRGPAVGPAQGRALLRLRGVRLRRADGHRSRLLRALPPAGAGDAGVAQDHRAGGQGDAARPGDGRGPQDRLARAAVDRLRRHGQHARTRPEDHGSVDGVADPPLQAGHRGLRGARGPGVHGGRVPARRAGLPPRLRRRHPADARAPARTQLREPADRCPR